jgi:hypothetical protein
MVFIRLSCFYKNLAERATSSFGPGMDLLRMGFKGCGTARSRPARKHKTDTSVALKLFFPYCLFPKKAVPRPSGDLTQKKHVFFEVAAAVTHHQMKPQCYTFSQIQFAIHLL